MAPPTRTKTNKRGTRSTESLHSVSPTASGITSRYNLRSHGPPNYERFADQECPICLEDYSSPIIVNCGHSFCSACIKRCIASESFKVCPVCKKDLVHQLFISNKDFTKRIQKRTPLNRSLQVNAKESDENENVIPNKNKQLGKGKGSRRTVANI